MLEHTFVVSAYGENSFLEECIQSLIHQTIASEIFASFLKKFYDKASSPIVNNSIGGIK
ncbi:hypothetical protein ACVRYA_07300 [Streptococcus respiraculi]